MSIARLKSREEYNQTMEKIEALIQKSVKLGGFEKLSKDDADTLASLSLLAEKYEDSIPLMPIKSPATLADMIRYKMFEKNLKQKQLAGLLEISESNISGLLSGKRKLTLEIAKKLHSKLNIDAHFILMSA